MSHERADAGRLVFAGALTIRTAEATHARLLEALHEHSDLLIDCRGATEVDLSFIQLVLAARSSAEASRKSLALAAPAAGALLDALSRGGFVSPPAAPGIPDDAIRAFWVRGTTAP